MIRQQWRGEYATIVTAYAQRPSDGLIRRAAELGEALAEARVSPQGFVAEHMACVEQLCAGRGGGDCTVLRGVTSLLLEVMKAYGRRLQDQRDTPPAAKPAHQSIQTLAGARKVQQALREGNATVRTRLEQLTAELTVAIERLQRGVTERKQTEQVLRESEDRVQLLTDALPVLISYVDAGQRYRFNNRAYEEWFGIPRAELDGRHISDVLGGQAYEAVRPYVEAALSGREVTYEKQVPCKGGGTRYVSARYVPHFSSDGQVKGFYTLVADVTERKRAEQTLEASEARYRAFTLDVLDTSTVGIFVLDNQFAVRWINQALERYFGLRRNEILGKDKRELVHRQIKNIFEDPESFAERVLATYKDNTHIQNFECHVLAGDSREERWLEHWSQPIRSGPYAGGRIEQYTDITKRKRAEQALRESEKRYHQLFESLNDAAFVADVETGRIVETNRQGELLLARPRDEIVGMHQSALHPPREDDTYKRVFASHVERGHAGDCDAEVIRKDGVIVPVTISASTLSVGGHQLILGLFRDMTERKRAEQALQESGAKYRQLFATVSDAIMVFDGETKRFVDVNEATLRLYGYSREEFLRLGHPDITAEPEESRISIEQTLAGELTRIPLRYHKKKDGTVFPVEIAASVLALGNRRLLCGVVRDISERKRAEEEARQRQAELAHISRLTLIGEMASSLSHDISQPLSTILFYARGCVRRMRSGTADLDALVDVMEKVAMQAEAAGRIVRRLREFVSKRAPHFSTVDVNGVVRRSLSLVQSEISEAGIAAHLQLAESLPPVRADRIQLEQVILNLVRNGAEALQGVEAGPRELIVTTSSSAGDTITVAVHDTGAGLSVEGAERVFDSFFSTKPNGMGMGLSISRSIIESHGGRLWAASNVGCGATFQFSLPVMKGIADEGA
jgi:PAS domain S-box-containing protein